MWYNIVIWTIIEFTWHGSCNRQVSSMCNTTSFKPLLLCRWQRTKHSFATVSDAPVNFNTIIYINIKDIQIFGKWANRHACNASNATFTINASLLSVSRGRGEHYLVTYSALEISHLLFDLLKPKCFSEHCCREDLQRFRRLHWKGDERSTYGKKKKRYSRILYQLFVYGAI